MYINTTYYSVDFAYWVNGINSSCNRFYKWNVYPRREQSFFPTFALKITSSHSR